MEIVEEQQKLFRMYVVYWRIRETEESNKESIRSVQAGYQLKRERSGEPGFLLEQTLSLKHQFFFIKHAALRVTAGVRSSTPFSSMALVLVLALVMAFEVVVFKLFE